MKKSQIGAWHTEIVGWQNQDSVLLLFNSEKIIKFYSSYSKEIEEIEREVLELRKKYFKFDGDNMLMHIDPVGGSQGILLDGVTEDEVAAAWTKLMNEEVQERVKLKIVKSIN